VRLSTLELHQTGIEETDPGPSPPIFMNHAGLIAWPTFASAEVREDVVAKLRQAVIAASPEGAFTIFEQQARLHISEEVQPAIFDSAKPSIRAHPDVAIVVLQECAA
jgi:hypothetical protein